MDRPVTLWLPEDDYNALALVATRYGRSVDAQARVWIQDPLQDAVRHFSVAQWEARKRAIAADPDLAATIDRAVRP